MMKNRITHILPILLLLAAAAVPTESWGKVVPLIKSVGQLSSNSIDRNISSSGDSDEAALAHLIDGDPGTNYHSLKNAAATAAPYIEVDLGGALSLEDNEDLLIHVRRHSLGEGCHPTTFRVEGYIDNGDGTGEWKFFCHIYLLYRGQKTHEFSSKIRPQNNEKFTKLRFTVTANNTREYNTVGTEHYRYMGLSEFQIYKIARGDVYPFNYKDRLHLTSDYSLNYKDWKFKNTQGPLATENKIDGWDWPGDTDKAELEKYGIELPSYEFIKTASGQDRQPVHTTEHELYAIPGDPIALYPYYQLRDNANYRENFSHWYDWETGGRLEIATQTGEPFDVLDFLNEPMRVIKTDNIGYLAGSALQGETRTYNTVINVGSVDEYIEFVNRVNAGETRLCMNITANLDFTGRTVDPLGLIDPFCGYINGNDHTISNLRIVRSNEEGVGLVRHGGDNLIICNLTVDASCYFEGTQRVALVAFGNNSLTIKFSNVAVMATFKGNGTPANGDTPARAAINIAGFHGCAIVHGQLVFENCFFGGVIDGAQDCAAFSGWMGDNVTIHKLTNCYNAGTIAPQIVKWSNNLVISSANEEQLNAMLTNCYSNVMDGITATSIQQLPENYTVENFKVEYPFNTTVALSSTSYLERTHGTTATFFYPRNPYVEGGVLQDLPKEEYVIAADFSQTYNESKNKVDGDKTFVEPTLAFRHIFRIKSGKKFADEFSGSKEANDEYIRKHMRHVTARANVPFQIRFDSPVPVWNSGATPPSKYYYKISDTDYRRVRAMDIVVLDAATRNPVTGMDFKSGEGFYGQGARSIDGLNYKICGGGGVYDRMLMCSNPKEGRYIVQLIGKDINNNRIKIIGTDDDLIVMEYMINFVPESAASMITEAELYDTNDKYKHAREEVLEENYGKPKDVVNFDEYKELEGTNEENKYLYKNETGHRYFKWPVEWENSNYAFGYNLRQDYNMYMLGNHHSVTPYYAAAQNFPNNYGEPAGLYDRLFYKTRRQHKTDPANYPESTLDRGYFYYVNASTDPGVMAKLTVDKLCLGSTIHVSAWVAEFSAVEETANIAFNFIAVVKETGQRVPLHSFVSGYVPGGSNMPADKYGDYRGQWMNIYYSFIPDFSDTGLTSDMVDHYELELDNNCKNSGGADYAIDNIRIYIVQPVIYASQMTLSCDEKVNKPSVKVQTPFGVLLQTIGQTEASEKSEDFNLYYSFIDKKKFDEVYEKTGSGAEAYDNAVLKYNYFGGTEVTNYGKLTFNRHYESNPEYSTIKPNEISKVALRELGDGNERMIVFNSMPDDSSMSTGKEYYLALAVDEIGKPAWENPGWDAFDIKNPCAKLCVFRVRPASVVKVDGFIANDFDNLRCCENQSPVIQVDLYGQNDKGEVVAIDENAYFDWFEGTTAEYNAVEKNGIKLSEAMLKFRFVYPDAESMTDVVQSPDGLQLTQPMIDLIKEYATPVEGALRPRLHLHKSSYVFPPVKFADNQQAATIHVLAVPIERDKNVETGALKICAAPTEVRMHVDHSAPNLSHGLHEGVKYPAAMEDVPIRVSLKQLKQVTGSDTRDETHSRWLNVPVRFVESAGSEATVVDRLRLKTDTIPTVFEYPVYLVETNDPQYKNVGTVDGSGNSRGLREIGEVKNLTANVKEQSGNSFDVRFISSFIFKEGYYYRMRFFYEEDVPPKQPEPGNEEEKPVVCDGQEIFTIKVVPEYQKWTGKENRNWNNDLNWSRVTSEDLHNGKYDGNDYAEYVTDGSNNREFSYAPLDFTKVIVENNGKPYPYLYDMNTEAKEGYTNLPDYNNTVLWPANPSEVKGDTEKDYPYFPAEGVGAATADVQYDMAGYFPKGVEEAKLGVNCRPWYANKCEQIHFKPESEIMNQQYLAYQKSWVDMELSHSRWYTLASPLQEVYAGDMYLPSANGRQETELFTDIEFKYGTNDRFKPAVFQRGWNRANTTVYELPAANGGNGVQTNVAIQANWSHVFNDVREVYGLGNGFSLKTDVSAMTTKPADTDKVLFRLPKNDKFFDYYNQDGSIMGDKTEVQRQSGHYKLNEAQGTLTSTTMAGNNFFLVGNPFMTHLDMAEFLKANETVIEPMYWMFRDGCQQAAVFDESSQGFVGGDNLGVVAPMQGFFVQAKEGAAVVSGESQTLTLSYNGMMMADGSFAEGGVKLMTRGTGSSDYLRITAANDGMAASDAVVRIAPEASRDYLTSEDAVAIDNTEIGIESIVYTVAGNKAVSVNSSDNAEGIEIGVIAKDDAVTTLTFEGVDAVSGMMLYDAADNSYADIYEGMQVEVKGTVSGRLFLTAGMEKDTFETLKWYLTGNVLTITSGLDDSVISAKVYDVSGRTVATDSAEGPELRMTLAEGIYIFEATDGNRKVNGKLLVK